MTKKQKLYCYVDETGQDTKGRLFVVAVVVTGEERDLLAATAERIEQESCKGIAKWKKTSLSRRVLYLDRIMASPLFFDTIRYASFFDRKDYRELTIWTTAHAIEEKAPPSYEATILIDALGKTERFAVGLALRHRNIKVRKVRGITDEADPLIRLADAMAGMIRGYLEGNEPLIELYERALRSGVLKEIKAK